MKFITVSESRLKATEIVRKFENIMEEVIVTKNGKPVVLMKFITDEVFSLKEDENERGGDENERENGKEKRKHSKGHL